MGVAEKYGAGIGIEYLRRDIGQVLRVDPLERVFENVGVETRITQISGDCSGDEIRTYHEDVEQQYCQCAQKPWNGISPLWASTATGSLFNNPVGAGNSITITSYGEDIVAHLIHITGSVGTAGTRSTCRARKTP